MRRGTDLSILSVVSAPTILESLKPPSMLSRRRFNRRAIVSPTVDSPGPAEKNHGDQPQKRQSEFTFIAPAASLFQLGLQSRVFKNCPHQFSPEKLVLSFGAHSSRPPPPLSNHTA